MWNDEKHRIKDRIVGIEEKNVSSTDELIHFISNEISPQICILSHPGNWREDMLTWIKWTTLQFLRNRGKEIFLKMQI